MARRSEYDKYYSAMVLVGCLLVIVNLYYYLSPLLYALNLTFKIVDIFITKLYNGGVFSTPLTTKLLGCGLISAGLITQTGKGSNVSWVTVIIAAVLGMGLYLFPYVSSVVYFLTTCTGLVIFSWAVATAGRKFSAFKEAINDRNETFMQCVKKYKNPDSINIPMKFQYQRRIRKGWINVINPFRATMVLGTPGSVIYIGFSGLHLRDLAGSLKFKMQNFGFTLYFQDFLLYSLYTASVRSGNL